MSNWVLHLDAMEHTVGIGIPNIQIPETFENRTYRRLVHSIQKPDIHVRFLTILQRDWTGACTKRSKE